MSDFFIVFLIHLSFSSVRYEYTPGLSIRPHPFPKEVTPTSPPLHTSGPPESPYRENHNHWKAVQTLTGGTAVKSLQTNIHRYLPDKCQLHFPRLNRHISCHWWSQDLCRNTQESCTSLCRPHSHWRTSRRRTYTTHRLLSPHPATMQLVPAAGSLMASHNFRYFTSLVSFTDLPSWNKKRTKLINADSLHIYWLIVPSIH